MKTPIGADRNGKPPLSCSLLLHSSLTPLPGQWDRRQSCKYTLGATFVITSQNFLIACHKSFGRVTIARHKIKHVLWRTIAARVAFYSRPDLICFFHLQIILRSADRILLRFSIRQSAYSSSICKSSTSLIYG